MPLLIAICTNNGNDQCWNILHPTYFGFNIEGILAAAKNTTTTGDDLKATTGITYSYGIATPGASSGSNWAKPSGAIDINDVKADLFMRWAVVADKMTKDVKDKLGDCWNTRGKEPILTPLIISGIMSGLSFISIFMASFIQLTEEFIKLIVIIGILFSLFSITSILCGILRANDFDKGQLKGVTFPKTELQYIGNTNWYRIGQPHGDGTQNTGIDPVDETDLTTENNYYFQVRNMTDPVVQVKEDRSAAEAKTYKLAKANIIATVELFV